MLTLAHGEVLAAAAASVGVQRRVWRADDPLCYVISAPSLGRVKIGSSTFRGVEQRTRSIQAASPAPLVYRLLLRGDVEPALHEVFRERNTHCEWFEGVKDWELSMVARIFAGYCTEFVDPPSH